MKKSHTFIFFILVILNVILNTFSSFHCINNIKLNYQPLSIQTEINNAVSGDVITIPKGRYLCTSTVNIPSDKKITLQGEGSDETIIISYMSSPVINMNRSGSRVTNIGFELGNNSTTGISVRGINWRIDNCRFNNTRTDANTVNAVYAYGNSESDGHPIGVVDHCTFYESRVVVFGSLSLLANTIWREPLGLGSNNAVFVQDNVFTRTHGNAIDSNYGGRYVFRYNEVNDAYIEAHSVQGENRASRSWEIYGNEINQVNIAMWIPFSLRGGTGVVFNNTLNGNFTELKIGVDNRRFFESFPVCGTMTGFNDWDGNDDGYGYPGRDQIGRSTDNWLWTDSNPYPTQALDPAYCWNNLHNGTTQVVFGARNGCEAIIVENRDYYNNTSRPGYIPFGDHPLVP